MINYNDFLYFDIETVGKYKTYDEYQTNDTKGAELFNKKYSKNEWMIQKCDNVNTAFEEFGGLFSTYGKMVCFSFGYFTTKNKKGYTVNSIYGNNEEELLIRIKELLDKVNDKGMGLSGYIINGFDIPFLVHKFHSKNISLPTLLDNYDKKPWDLKIFDLADKWKFGAKYFASLDEVCYELGIESPKDDIDGSEVHKVYWYDGDLERIKTYCEKDVTSTMLISKKMIG